MKAYYEALGQFDALNVEHEMAVRSAFQHLLQKCGSQFHWTLVPEFSIARRNQAAIRVDGALLDDFKLKRGFWEAKDGKDDLEKEVKKKIAAGYPTDNIIFQAPKRAILYQNGVRQALNEDISSPDNLVELLRHFFEYRAPQHEEWEAAVAEFKERLPEIAAGAKKLIDDERKKNKAFVARFDEFYALCRQAINPNLSEAAVENMLIQHLLTERIFRKIFDNPDFTQRNVIAVEIEKVIRSLTSRHFNRDAFLKELDRFYKAIELNAENTSTYAEKQGFLNSVYERFFQGYSPKEADRHGIVYTPQPIVNFMVRSVKNILQKEFGRSLSDKGVHILDPFVGTGNFIVRIMQEITKTALPYKYENELHCNEVMLLPYYIASMNLEHAYLEATGEYRPFPGICLVDTFELAEARQASLGFMTEENTQRVARQKESPIFVVLGNPPYNAWQVDENDENKNRKYKVLDERVAETYSKSSHASNKNALSDPYVKAIRWASDRIGDEGIVALVTNSGFLDGIATDGMRQHLAADFDDIFVLDLGGNVRKNPKLSGTTHNVFGIQVGVSINLFLRRKTKNEPRHCKVFYGRVDEFWTRHQKYEYLEEVGDRTGIDWRIVTPDGDSVWLTAGLREEFSGFVPMFSSIFAEVSNGLKTNRDAWAYNFTPSALATNIRRTITFYNTQVDRWKQHHAKYESSSIDEVVSYDEREISWSSSLKEDVKRGRYAEFSKSKMRKCLYRPFTAMTVFLDRMLNERVYQIPSFFPTPKTEKENRTIWLKVGSDWPMFPLAVSTIPDVLPQGGSQCFPFYTYDKDGSNRRENITDWALEEFRKRYGDGSITKWDVFHYVYGVLHHPEYRERYAANLRRELPRVPFVGAGKSEEQIPHDSAVQNDKLKGNGNPKEGGKTLEAGEEQIPHDSAVRNDKLKRGNQKASDIDVFRAFVSAGKRLAELHVGYESVAEYPLERVEAPGERRDLRVEKMKLSKDKTSLRYNDFLTLKGIPAEAFEYRLGNRSGLEWVVDQYQVFEDKRSGIVNDPNREDDEEYILRLVGQVTTVSLETVKIVKGLPEWVV